MLNNILKSLIICLFLAQCARVVDIPTQTSWSPDLTQRIPPRPPFAVTGSQFAERVWELGSQQREQAIGDELLRGNLPDFLRNLVPVRLEHITADGKTITATIFVMPDYLAIGSNEDFLRIPMDLHTAAVVAGRFGFVLPTSKMVDAIYEQAPRHFQPVPMTPGPEMRSTAYYRIHNQTIEHQRLVLGVSLGTLVAGHKKDLVVSNVLAGNPGKMAIYGWHRYRGDPIQPLSTAHGAHYADYSHGIRLVSDIVLIDGRYESIYRVLQDPTLAAVLSDEGAIGNLELIMDLRAI